MSATTCNSVFQFTKMQGTGNDFVLLDHAKVALGDLNLPEIAQKLCDRHYGVGADGLLTVEPGVAAAWQMRMFNPDGSESEMCGNGLRCHARYIRDHFAPDIPALDIETGAGVLRAEFVESQVRVDMGPYRLGGSNVPLPHNLLGTEVSMGNPHVVIDVPDLATIPASQFGPEIEHLPRYPARTNVHFIQRLSPTHTRQMTWERGAGLTLACGTGACAVAVAAHLQFGSDRRQTVEVPGGQLTVEVLENGHVLLMGPATYVFDGEWPAAS